jgi:erythromycin esterase-like protein
VTDNGRNERRVATPHPQGVERFLRIAESPASYLILRGNSNAEVRAWAGASKPYLRMGIDSASLVPAATFDAMIYLEHVRPPDYAIR